MYQSNPLFENGQANHLLHYNNHEPYRNDLNNQSMELNSSAKVTAKPSPGHTTTSKLRQWRRPESNQHQDPYRTLTNKDPSHNHQSQLTPNKYVCDEVNSLNEIRHMNSNLSLPSMSDGTSVQSDYSQYSSQLSPPQQRPSSYENINYLPQCDRTSPAQKNGTFRDSFSDMYYRTAYPVQDTSPVSHKSLPSPDQNHKFREVKRKLVQNYPQGNISFDGAHLKGDVNMQMYAQKPNDFSMGSHDQRITSYEAQYRNFANQNSPLAPEKRMNQFYAQPRPGLPNENNYGPNNYFHKESTVTVQQNEKYEMLTKQQIDPRYVQYNQSCAKAEMKIRDFHNMPGNSIQNAPYAPLLQQTLLKSHENYNQSYVPPNMKYSAKFSTVIPRISPQQTNPIDGMQYMNQQQKAMVYSGNYGAPNKIPTSSVPNYKLAKEYEHSLYLHEMSQRSSKLAQNLAESAAKYTYMQRESPLYMENPFEHSNYLANTMGSNNMTSKDDCQSDYSDFNSLKQDGKILRPMSEYSTMMQGNVPRNYMNVRNDKNNMHYYDNVKNAHISAQFPVQHSIHPKHNEQPIRNISPRGTFQENMPYSVIPPPTLSQKSPIPLNSDCYNQQSYYGPKDPALQTVRQQQYQEYMKNQYVQRYPETLYQQQYQQRQYSPQIGRDHYQNLQQGYANPYISSDNSKDTSNKTKTMKDKLQNIKEFLENWDENEEMSANLPDLVLCNNPMEKKGACVDPKQENVNNSVMEDNINMLNLYVYETKELSSDNLGQYLHLEQVDHLPENIKGYFKINPAKMEHIKNNGDANVEGNVISRSDSIETNLTSVKSEVSDNMETDRCIDEVLNLSVNRKYIRQEHMRDPPLPIQQIEKSITKELENNPVDTGPSKVLEDVLQFESIINNSCEKRECSIENKTADISPKPVDFDATDSPLQCQSSVIVPNIHFDKTHDSTVEAPTLKDSVEIETSQDCTELINRKICDGAVETLIVNNKPEDAKECKGDGASEIALLKQCNDEYVPTIEAPTSELPFNISKEADITNIGHSKSDNETCVDSFDKVDKEEIFTESKLEDINDVNSSEALEVMTEVHTSEVNKSSASDLNDAVVENMRLNNEVEICAMDGQSVDISGATHSKISEDSDKEVIKNVIDSEDEYTHLISPEMIANKNDSELIILESLDSHSVTVDLNTDITSNKLTDHIDLQSDTDESESSHSSDNEDTDNANEPVHNCTDIIPVTETCIEMENESNDSQDIEDILECCVSQEEAQELGDDSNDSVINNTQPTETNDASLNFDVIPHCGNLVTEEPLHAAINDWIENEVVIPSVTYIKKKPRFKTVMVEPSQRMSRRWAWDKIRRRRNYCRNKLKHNTEHPVDVKDDDCAMSTSDNVTLDRISLVHQEEHSKSVFETVVEQPESVIDEDMKIQFINPENPGIKIEHHKLSEQLIYDRRKSIEHPRLQIQEYGKYPTDSNICQRMKPIINLDEISHNISQVLDIYPKRRCSDDKSYCNGNEVTGRNVHSRRNTLIIDPNDFNLEPFDCGLKDADCTENEILKPTVSDKSETLVGDGNAECMELPKEQIKSDEEIAKVDEIRAYDMEKDYSSILRKIDYYTMLSKSEHKTNELTQSELKSNSQLEFTNAEDKNYNYLNSTIRTPALSNNEDIRHSLQNKVNISRHLNKAVTKINLPFCKSSGNEIDPYSIHQAIDFNLNNEHSKSEKIDLVAGGTLSEYTKQYIESRTGQNIDANLKYICAKSKIASTIVPNNQTPIVSVPCIKKPVTKINLQDYRKRRQSISNSSVDIEDKEIQDEPHMAPENDVTVQSHRPKKRKKRFRNLYTDTDEDEEMIIPPKPDSVLAQPLDLKFVPNGVTEVQSNSGIKVQIALSTLNNPNNFCTQGKRPTFKSNFSVDSNCAKSISNQEKQSDSYESGRVESPGDISKRKCVPKVIIRRSGTKYQAVTRDVSTNVEWQPVVCLQRDYKLDRLAIKEISTKCSSSQSKIVAFK